MPTGGAARRSRLHVHRMRRTAEHRRARWFVIAPVRDTANDQVTGLTVHCGPWSASVYR